MVVLDLVDGLDDETFDQQRARLRERNAARAHVEQQILVDLGIRQIRLLTNNPKKVVGLDGYGLRIVERVPIQIPANENNAGYLKAKKEKLGHLLDETD